MQAQTAPRGEHAEPASSARRATKSRLRAFFATALALGLAACGGAPIDEELAEWGDDAEESETSRLGTASLALDSLRARPAPSPPVARPVFSPTDDFAVADIPPPPIFVKNPGTPVACPQCVETAVRLVACSQCVFVLEPEGVPDGLLYLPLDMSSEAVTLSFMEPTQIDKDILLSRERERHERRVYVVPRSEFSFGQVRAATVTDRSTGEVIPVRVFPPQAGRNIQFTPGPRLRLQEL